MLAALRADFEQMVGSGMFEGQPPVFDQIVDRLRVLERQVNAGAEKPSG